MIGDLGFPKIRATFLGVPIIRAIVYWGLYWGTLIWGNYHLAKERKTCILPGIHGNLLEYRFRAWG